MGETSRIELGRAELRFYWLDRIGSNLVRPANLPMFLALQGNSNKALSGIRIELNYYFIGMKKIMAYLAMYDVSPPRSSPSAIIVSSKTRGCH